MTITRILRTSLTGTRSGSLKRPAAILSGIQSQAWNGAFSQKRGLSSRNRTGLNGLHGPEKGFRLRELFQTIAGNTLFRFSVNLSVAILIAALAVGCSSKPVGHGEDPADQKGTPVDLARKLNDMRTEIDLIIKFNSDMKKRYEGKRIKLKKIPYER